MERIQETFRISWQENKETKTIEDLDKKTKKNVGYLVKIVEKFKKKFGIPAKKTRKPRTSMILTKEQENCWTSCQESFSIFEISGKDLCKYSLQGRQVFATSWKQSKKTFGILGKKTGKPRLFKILTRKPRKMLDF